MKKTNSATELSKYIQRPGNWTIPKIGLTIRVIVVDARKAYGRTELKVTPVNGSGEAWVRKVKLDKGRIV